MGGKEVDSQFNHKDVDSLVIHTCTDTLAMPYINHPYKDFLTKLQKP